MFFSNEFSALLFYYAFAVRQCRRRHSAKALCFRAVRPTRSFVRSCGQIFFPRYLLKPLNNFDKKTDRKYSIAPTDDLVIFWRWRLKIKGQSHSRPSRWRRYPRP